jgi:hypothetical protein
MASLKSFLYGAAPILGMTGAALYERQRALVNLKVLEPVSGRGPGSGVPLTPYNIAAVIISVLAAENLAEVDQRVVSIIKANPEILGRREHNLTTWKKAGSPTFCTVVGAVLAGEALPWPMDEPSKRRVHTIRVTRCWRGQLVWSPSGANPTEYWIGNLSELARQHTPIQITAEIERGVLVKLVSFTRGALSQVAEEEEDE